MIDDSSHLLGDGQSCLSQKGGVTFWKRYSSSIFRSLISCSVGVGVGVKGDRCKKYILWKCV